MADEKLNELNENEVVKHLASLFTEASGASKEARVRMANDLASSQGMLGDQWDEDDQKHRGFERAQYSLPVFPQMIESVVGTYSANPFGIQLSPVRSESKPKLTIAQTIVDGVADRSDFFAQTRLVLRNACACGVGYFHVLTEEREDAKSVKTAETAETEGEERKPLLDVKVEAILNPLSVYVDPYSIALDGSDARYVIIASALSCDVAKQKLGERWMEGTRSAGVVMDALASVYARDTQVPVMTVYEMQGGECWCYKTIGNVLAEKPFCLHVKQVPIVSAKGCFAWSSGAKRYESVGLCYRAQGAQKALNYANSLLMERLALSTKSEWTAAWDTIKDHREDWANLSHSNPPVLPYDDIVDGVKHDAPQKHSSAVELGDVQGAIGSYIGAIGSITGVGVDGNDQGHRQMTAEEVLTRSRASEAVLGSIFENLAAAVKRTGRVVLDFLRATYDGKDVEGKDGQLVHGAELLPGEFEVIVDAGVLTASVRRETVLQMLSLIDKVPASAQAVLPAILQNIDADLDEETIERVKALSAAPTPEQVASLQKENEAAKAQIAQLQQQLVDALAQRQAVEVKAKADLLKTEMNNRNDVELEAMKQGGENERTIARIQADYEARIAKLETEVQIALAKLNG